MTNVPGTWDPAQYARFRAERSQPFYDLAAMVEGQRGSMRVLDLGCGDGVLTAWLHEHLQAVDTVGVDSSEQMLAVAESHARPGLRFERGDIATFASDEPFDLVFANASLQWVPQHEALFPRLLGLLAPGGQLAVQMPANDDHISHRTAEEIASEEPYYTALGGYTRGFDRVLRPARYSELLWERGCVQQTVRLNVYPHVMPGYEAVIEWVRGTYLTAYESRLGPALFTQFMAAYERRIAAAITQRPYLYTYPRILLWGKRPDAAEA